MMQLGSRMFLIGLSFSLTGTLASAQPFIVECLPPVVVWPHCPPPIFVYPALPVPTYSAPLVVPQTEMQEAPPKAAVPEASSNSNDMELSPPKVDVIPKQSYNPIQPVEQATPQPAQPENAIPPSEALSEPRKTDEIGKIPALKLSTEPTEPGDLPPLSLPPGPSISKYSPLNDKPMPKIYLFPVGGSKPIAVDAMRTVGFFNHTDNDLSLTVQGDTITLPKRHYVKATVPTKFTWHLGDASNRTDTIPTASPGLEVVIRPKTKK